MAKQILIRADDLGYSEGVNYGLAKSVKDGIIRCVGVMPNMPSVQHGLDLLKGLDICYGQHTNICVGKPLTDPSKIPSLVQENGEFKTSRMYRQAEEDFVALDEVVLEIEAQYQAYLSLLGEKPRYFEAHAVMSGNLSRGLEIVAKRHGLAYLPLSFQKPVKFRGTVLYPFMESMEPDYDPFESLKRAALRNYKDGVCMFICHPGYLDDELLRTSSLTLARTKEVTMSCSKETHEWLLEKKIEVITYDNLK